MYTDLLLRIFPLDAANNVYPIEAELSDGSRFTGGQLKLDQEALLAQQSDAEAYGTALFKSLFAGDLRRAYDKATSLAEAETGGRLRVRLWVDDDAVELHAIPWERLYTQQRDTLIPLGAATLTPFSRYTSLETREPLPIAETPLRMLVVVANPTNLPGGLAPANVDLEVENIRKSLAELRRDNKIQVTLMPGRTGLAPALKERLTQEGYTVIEGVSNLFNLAPHLAKCHIFHFIGHGAFRKTAGGGGGTAALYLEKADGAWQAVKDEEIVSMLTAVGTLPHLTFLVACESASRDPGAASPFVGLGPKLVQAGVPAVVAMQDQVPVELARLLSGEFYARLAEHGEVDRALNQARRQVFDQKSTAWAIPVLFMRIKSGRLFGAETEDDAPAPGEPPFKGLQYFTENDADKFFGRELLTAKLVGRLRESRFLAVVVGASGSGKSSVVRAGMLPALKSGEKLADGTLPPEGCARWPRYILTPAARPLEMLAAALTRDSDSVSATTALIEDLAVDQRALHLYAQKLITRNTGGAQRLLVIVDQFEEIFTLCKDEATRRAFINNLLYASASTTDGPTVVIIVFRADFYAKCGQYDNLREAVSQRQEFVGPMNRDELRRAIETPAQRGGWDLEAGLVEVILKDVGEEPGALPLLQHALLETWKRRRGRLMTIKGYTDAGGVSGAIANTAESIYQNLPSDQKPIAKRIFLRLVEINIGSQSTRRRASLEELSPRAEDRPVVEAVLKTLVDNRLVVTTDTTAEVAHEALIREWPTFREWIDQNREGLRTYRDLADAAKEWDGLARDEGVLYRGVRLIQAIEWVEENPNELTQLEREFLDTSRSVAEREAREEEEQRRRELEAAKKLAEEQSRVAETAKQLMVTEQKRSEEQARAAFVMRRRAIALAGVLVVAVIAAAAAAVFANLAQFAEDQAQAASTKAVAQQGTAQAASTKAIAQQAIALTQQAEAMVARRDADLQRDEAEKARDKAQQQYQLASSRELSAQALNNISVDPERSVWLALGAISLIKDNAVALEANADAVSALHRTIQALRVEGVYSISATSAIYSLALSPNERFLAVGGDDHQITLFDFASRQMVRTFQHGPANEEVGGEGEEVLALAFASDSETLATGSADSTVKTWNVLSGELRQTFIGHMANVNSVEFDSTGERLLTSSADGTARVWNTRTGQVLFTLGQVDQTPYVHQATFSADGRFIATANGNLLGPNGRPVETTPYQYTAQIWDATNGRLLLTLDGHTDQVLNVAFNTKNTMLATSSADRTAKIWNLTLDARQRPIAAVDSFTLAHPDWARGVAFSHDDSRLVTGSFDHGVRVWITRSGTLLYFLPGHKVFVYTTLFTADGTRVVSASRDGTARLWNVTQSGSRELYTFNLNDRVYGLAYSRDGMLIAAGGRGNFARVWDATTGQTLYTLRGHTDGVEDLAFSPNNRRLVTAARDATARVWDLSTGQTVLTFTGHTSRIYGVTYSPDGQYIATAGRDPSAVIWDATTGQTVTVLTGHTDIINSIQYNPSGQYLVTASNDRTAIVWDAQTGEPVLTLDGHSDFVQSATFSPDGRYIATGSDDTTAILWDLSSGTPVVTFTGGVGPVFSVRFSPDGQQLVTTSGDGLSRLWEVTTGRELVQLYGHVDRVYAAVFSPAGDRLVTASADGTVRVYVTSRDALLALAKSRVTRTLTVDECHRYLLPEPCP